MTSKISAFGGESETEQCFWVGGKISQAAIRKKRERFALALPPHLHSALTLPLKNTSNGAERQTQHYVCGETQTKSFFPYQLLFFCLFV